MNCTRCEGTGILNHDQVADAVMAAIEKSQNGGDAMAFVDLVSDDEIEICDCCGDGSSEWYGEPGQHCEDDFGPGGPYAYNGGLPECS